MDNSTPFRTFGTMLDCSRNAVPNLHTLKKWVDLTASLGYNTLLLYTEDTYEVTDEPYFGYMRGRYSQAELRELDAYANERGMTIMPCIQTLAHLYAIKRWPEYWPHFDTDDILLAGDERVYTLIDHMFRSLAASLSCRTIHLGMDEAEMFARGRYYNQHGDCNRSQALLAHLQRVCEIGETYGFRFLIWSDMFFKLATGGQYYAQNAQIDESVREKIPANVELVYWDYYSADEAHYDGMIEAHQKLKPSTWFAGGLWKWTGYAPHNGYSMKITKAALASCREHGVQDVFLTMWGDDGGECSPFTLLPSLFYASELAKGETDDETIKAHFAQRFGAAFDDFMQLDLPGTRNGLDDNVRNLDKFLLYNDPFMGMMDQTVCPVRAHSSARAPNGWRRCRRCRSGGTYLRRSVRCAGCWRSRRNLAPASTRRTAQEIRQRFAPCSRSLTRHLCVWNAFMMPIRHSGCRKTSRMALTCRTSGSAV